VREGTKVLYVAIISSGASPYGAYIKFYNFCGSIASAMNFAAASSFLPYSAALAGGASYSGLM